MVQFTGLDLKHVTMANLTSYNKRIRRIADYYILQIKGGRANLARWPAPCMHDMAGHFSGVSGHWRPTSANQRCYALTSAAMR